MQFLCCDIKCIWRMIRVQWNLVLGAGTFLWMLTLSRGDTEVSCVSMETCILPCSFQVGPDVEIDWIQVKAGNLHVHSYYSNQDQLHHQDQSFRNRTSLFKDQISRGNASLQLTGVEVQDQGRYQCFTSTMRENKESFINLKVDEPPTNVGLIIGGVLGAAAAVTTLVLLLRQRKLCKQLQEQEEQLQEQEEQLREQDEQLREQEEQLREQEEQLREQLRKQEEQLRKKLHKQLQEQEEQLQQQQEQLQQQEEQLRKKLRKQQQ